MHELSLAQAVLDTIEQQSIQQDFSSVKTLCIDIGKLSCVEPDTLTWYLEQISINTSLEGASIMVTHRPGHAICNRCQTTFETEELYHSCPNCGVYDSSIIDGKEMKLVSMDVI